MHIALNILGHCHSSACVELGRTRVLCIVRRPQQLIQEYRGTRGRVSCQLHRAPSGAAAATTGSGTLSDDLSHGDRDMALALEGVAEQLVVLESIPQLLVEVVIEVVSDDGGVWDAASTAMAAALAVGGFEMYDLFSSCSAGLLSDGSIVTDMTSSEVRNALVTVEACTALTTGDIAFLSHHGTCEFATLMELTQAAMKGVQVRRSSIVKQIRGQ